ncbi:MAG TPA: hypothetical protein VEV43_01830 [Actinomycetota bacterium]|nr:hypothetical protein [Actinomycetota bacterium]
MFYGGFVYGILAPLTILGVIVLAILALSGRSDPDTRGDRARVLYLSLVSFIALFTVLFALVSLGSTAARSLLDDGQSECIDPSDPACFGIDAEFGGGEQHTRELLNSTGVAVVAAAVLVFHRRRTREVVDDPGFAGSAAARTFNAYLYAVAFTAMVLLLAAAAVALPALIRTIAPGLTATGDSSFERDAALLDLVPALVAGAGAAVIYLTHWRAASALRRGGND